ncbi:hypothetical protein L4D15_05200 [Enterovibrio norvegicus]|uniref:hypothetical protein n=1 Tax=Enterovibrio norvegicus TaxID=188144 RepID=UPI003D09783D
MEIKKKLLGILKFLLDNQYSRNVIIFCLKKFDKYGLLSRILYSRGRFKDFYHLVNENLSFFISRYDVNTLLKYTALAPTKKDKEKLLSICTYLDVTCVDADYFQQILPLINGASTFKHKVETLYILKRFEKKNLNVIIPKLVSIEGLATNREDPCEREGFLCGHSNEEKLQYLYLFKKYKEIIESIDSSKVLDLNAKTFNLYFFSVLQEKKMYLLRDLIDHPKLKNKLLNEYYYALGDFNGAFESMKTREMAKVCRQGFGQRYVQDMSSLMIGEELIILNSWGVGDDVRYSMVLDHLLELGFSLSVTCDPRLQTIFRCRWPRVRFLGSYRSKCVTHTQSSFFEGITHAGLSHLMDTVTENEIRNCNGKITLMTDVVSDIALKSHKHSRYSPSYLDISKRVTIDSYIRRLRKNGKPLLGVCWRSNINNVARSSHYFPIEDMTSILSSEDYTVVNLQHNLSSSETHLLSCLDISIPPLDLFNDLESLFYLIYQLDKTVCPGTATLEISGFVGTETYFLTNSMMQNYRVIGNNDIWYSNVKFVDSFSSLCKSTIVEEVLDALKND